MKAWFKNFQKRECDIVCELLSSYIDSELNYVERQEVEAHIESCESCRKELESLQKTMVLVRNIPELEPRRSFTISEETKITRDNKVKILVSVTALVAVCLVAVFIGDISHLFDAMPLPSQPWSQPIEINRYYWAVRETEIGLLCLFVVLAVVSFWYWYRNVRKSRKSK